MPRRPRASAPRPLRVQAEPAFRTRHANPYNALLSEHLQQRGVEVEELSLRRLVLAPPDVVHVHWPELTFLSGRRWWRTAWRVGSFALALGVARARRGTALVWTVHNLAPHERDGAGLQHRLFWRAFTARLDGFLTLTETAVASARAAHPALARVPGAVTPHGDFRDEVDRELSREGARERTGLPAQAPVLLFAGQVRGYKRVPDLLRAFAGLADPAARLVVAGHVAAGPAREELVALGAQDPRVVLDLGFLPAERLSDWLRAADLVVLPYSAVLNSGAALLALSADRPVLAPALGALPELQAEVGAAWLRTFSGDLTTSDLEGALAWAGAAERGAEPDLSGHAWPLVARLTEEAFARLRRPQP